MKTLYTAHVNTIGGRDGQSKTSDNQFSVILSKPGSKKPGVNPEQLFAVGYSACFGGAIEAAANQHQVKITESKINAEVDLNQDDNGFFISARLNVILDGVDTETAKKIVSAAHKICPYSKATRGNIKVELTVNGEALES